MINYFINLLLYIKIKSYLYFSFYLNKVEDCIFKIYTKNKILFYFYQKYDLKACTSEKFSYYPNDGNPIISNEPYKEGETIYMDILDNFYQFGYVEITITINEYEIKTDHRKFWKCLNCINDNHNSDYIIRDSDSKFYFYKNMNGFKEHTDNFFNFTFKINSILELNYNQVGIKDSFYALNPSNNFYLELYYKYDVVELINFNTTDNFYIKDNKSLFVNYTNYYFEVIFENEIKGTLKGLNSDNFYTNITNNGHFKVNKTNGLIYLLNPNEKKSYTIILKLKITAYNYYLNRPVTKGEFFNFNITRIGNYFKMFK